MIEIKKLGESNVTTLDLEVFRLVKTLEGCSVREVFSWHVSFRKKMLAVADYNNWLEDKEMKKSQRSNSGNTSRKPRFSRRR